MRQLARTDLSESACASSIAAVVIDCVCLVLGAAAIRGAMPKPVLVAVAEKLEPELSQLKPLLGRMAETGRSFEESAKAVFEVVKTIWSVGKLGPVMHAILHHLTFWQQILYGVTAVATITAAVPTDGLAMIPELALALANAGPLVINAAEAVETCDRPSCPADASARRMLDREIADDSLSDEYHGRRLVLDTYKLRQGGYARDVITKKGSRETIYAPSPCFAAEFNIPSWKQSYAFPKVLNFPGPALPSSLHGSPSLPTAQQWHFHDADPSGMWSPAFDWKTRIGGFDRFSKSWKSSLRPVPTSLPLTRSCSDYQNMPFDEACGNKVAGDNGIILRSGSAAQQHYGHIMALFQVQWQSAAAITIPGLASWTPKVMIKKDDKYGDPLYFKPGRGSMLPEAKEWVKMYRYWVHDVNTNPGSSPLLGLLEAEIMKALDFCAPASGTCKSRLWCTASDQCDYF